MPSARANGLSASQYSALVKGLIAHAHHQHEETRYTARMAEPIRLLHESEFPKDNTESWSKRLTTMSKWFDVIRNDNNMPELVEKSTRKLVIPAAVVYTDLLYISRSE